MESENSKETKLEQIGQLELSIKPLIVNFIKKIDDVYKDFLLSIKMDAKDKADKKAAMVSDIRTKINVPKHNLVKYEDKAIKEVKGMLSQLLKNCNSTFDGNTIEVGIKNKFATVSPSIPSPKINCWDFVKCGREFEGEGVAEMSICPASIDISADGLNEGKNGGRICWAIAGTFCREKIKGFFAKKLLSCKSCQFFKTVKKEEGELFSIKPKTFLSSNKFND